MQKLVVSIVRLSTAVTLYSLEQLQSSMNFSQSSEELNQAMEKFQGTLDSLSDILAGKLGNQKKETLQSITDMTEDVVSRSADGMSIMDPREMLRTTTDMLQKSSDAMADWVGKVTSTESEEPKRAADVL